MPAVGDLRNRLLALADTSVLGNPAIYRLFSHRFPADADPRELRARLDRVASGADPRVVEIPEPLRSIVTRHLASFVEAMPTRFDLRRANVGNLVLAGGYLEQGRSLDSVVYLFSQLVEVRGVVRPIVDRNLHLAAELADGRTVVGQHLITGKERPPLSSPVRRLFLTRSKSRPAPVRPRISEQVDELIRSSDLICYPMGSFYSSLIATLLPHGVSDAIAGADVPKVYVPNPGPDPEELGLSPARRVQVLLRYLRDGCARRTGRDRLLHFMLADPGSRWLTRKVTREIQKLGVEVVRVPLITASSRPYFDDASLGEALLSLA